MKTLTNNSVARKNNTTILSSSHFPNIRKTGEFLTSLSTSDINGGTYTQKFSQEFSKFSQNFSRDTF